MHVAVCVHTSSYKKEKVKEEREADMKTKKHWHEKKALT